MIYIFSRNYIYNNIEDDIQSILYSFNLLNIEYTFILCDDLDTNLDTNIIEIIYNENKLNYFIFFQTDSYTHLDKNIHKDIIKRSFIVNIEQLSPPGVIDSIKEYSIKEYIMKGYGIIDYNEENINIINRNINIDNNRIFFIPYQVNPNELLNIKKENDICTINPNSQNRNCIVNFSKEIININIVEGFGLSRDQQLFNNKALLNIHYHDTAKIFEDIRCDRLIFNKMFIISEKSIDTSINNDIKEFILEFNTQKELEIILNNIKENFDMVYDTIFKNFNLESIQKGRLEYVNKFKNELFNL